MPTNFRKYIVYAFLFIFVVILITLILQPRFRARFQPKGHFIVSDLETRVLYEPGAEDYASKIIKILQPAIEKVETEHLFPFQKSFKVYVFNTQASFNKHMGDPPNSLSRGSSFLGNVFITPRAFNFHCQDTHHETLIHELSHLHVTQALGFSILWKNIPFWFSEGLADNVANTGGETISDDEAITAIRTGNTFIPDDKNRFLIPKYPPDYGMEWLMFKAQSKMFVKYLKVKDPEAFRKLLKSIYKWETFSESFAKYYGNTVIDEWDRFESKLH